MVNSCENLEQVSGLDVRNIDIVYILDPFLNIRKLHFVQAREIMTTGFVTDEIFPWPKIEDLLHELFGDLEKPVDSSRRRKLDFLTFQWSAGNDS